MCSAQLRGSLPVSTSTPKASSGPCLSPVFQQTLPFHMASGIKGEALQNYPESRRRNQGWQGKKNPGSGSGLGSVWLYLW